MSAFIVNMQERIKEAESMLQQGDRARAAKALFVLENEATDKRTRLQLIDLLLTASNPIDGGKKLLDLSAEAIRICEEFGQPLLKAHFMVCHAQLLLASLIFPEHEKANLKMPGEWLEFALEQEKERCEFLTKMIVYTKSEISRLLDEAMTIAQEKDNKALLSRALSLRGEIKYSEALRLKIECRRNLWGAKLWLKYDLFRRPFFDLFLLSNKDKRGEVKNMFHESTEDLLRSAQISQDLNDVAAGYVYLKLAHNLSTVYNFYGAKKYLKLAIELATKYEDKLLLSQAKKLESIINSKNRDVPNYLEGERRED